MDCSPCVCMNMQTTHNSTFSVATIVRNVMLRCTNGIFLSVKVPICFICTHTHRALLATAHQSQPLPQTLSVLESTPQVRGLHTIIRWVVSVIWITSKDQLTLRSWCLSLKCVFEIHSSVAGAIQNSSHVWIRIMTHWPASPFSLRLLCTPPQFFCLFFRNKDTSRDEFIFYSKRLMRLLIEHALSFLPSKVCGCFSCLNVILLCDQSSIYCDLKHT